MINLAPNHKIGLVVANPILLAGGAIGCGDALHRGVRPERLGGVVVGPITRHSQPGSAPPRLASTIGGFVLDSGVQNRGISVVLRRMAPQWVRLGCPVIAQIADTRPAAAGEVAERLMGVAGLAGLELLVRGQASPEEVAALVRTVYRHSDLPLWVKLPLEQALLLAPAAVEAGADALVAGQPPGGMGYAPGREGVAVRGALYGPLVFHQMLAVLIAIHNLGLRATLIACGGVHTPQHVHQALAAGAQAVQIDSAVWVEPGLPARLAGLWA